MDNKNWLSPFNSDFWGDRFLSQSAPRFFGDFFRSGSFGPSVDLEETDKEIILHADIPGANHEDLDVSVEENAVILKGETKRDQIREEKGYHLTERRYGSFYRTIPLPAEVKYDQAVARYRNGVLELRIPKAESATRRGFRPKIQSDDQRIQ